MKEKDAGNNKRDKSLNIWDWKLITELTEMRENATVTLKQGAVWHGTLCLAPFACSASSGLP